MKFKISVLLVFMMLTLVGCEGNETQNNAPVVNNPSQNENLSYETNKDGYITSCELNIGGKHFTYQCEGDHYLLIDDANGEYVISEQEPVADSYIGASNTVKRFYFYAGTAQVMVTMEYEKNDDTIKGLRVQIYNEEGQLVVEREARKMIGDFRFSLVFSPGAAIPLLDQHGQPAKDAEGNYLKDENAISISEHVTQKTENGVLINGNLTSTTYYNLADGKEIYSYIYDVDGSFVKKVYDRNDYHLVYQEVKENDTFVERSYNADGSYSETVTDLITMEIVSQGNYTADGTLIN